MISVFAQRALKIFIEIRNQMPVGSVWTFYFGTFS